MRAPQDIDHPDEADAELDELFDLLDLNDEWLTGFFAAFFVGPDLVKPSEWLPRVMGDHVFFDGDEGAGVSTFLWISTTASASSYASSYYDQ